MDERTDLRRQYPRLFSLVVAGGALTVVALSMVLIPHPGFAVWERVTLALVVVVSVVARLYGARAGILSAFAAVAVLLAAELLIVGQPPIDDIVDLVVDGAIFLGVALVQGIQTGEMRDREREALRARLETDLLMRLGAQLVPDSPMARALVGLDADVKEVLGAREITLFVADQKGDLSFVRPETEEVLKADPQMLEVARWVFRRATAVGDLSPLLECDGTAAEWPTMVAHADVSPGIDRDDTFIPLLSMSAIEGVLRVAPRLSGHAIDCHELATLQFVARLFATFRERQRLQQRAAQSESVKEADRLKSALVSSVSHEIKTPLSAARATLTSLLESDAGGELTEEVREDLASIEQDLQLLQRHIGRLLEISRLEASNWKPAIEWNDVADLCATVRSASPEEDRERIEVRLAANLPVLQFDFVQMSRALHHLTENALAYGGTEGVVTIGAEPTATGGVRLWVEDSGPGVVDEEKEAVFEKFYRGAASPRQPHGTGLGLAIARDIAAAHGARLWVEDVDPHGARFVMELSPDDAKAGV